MHKIVIIGLDGFDPQRIREWIDDLPNLKRMRSGGIWGDLESVVPPAAPQTWVTLQCGRNPGAYGLWDYRYRDRFAYQDFMPANSHVLNSRVNCLHKLLPKLGQRVGLINVPLTGPAPHIHGGYCISDIGSGQNGKVLTWPPSLRQDLLRLVGQDIFDPIEDSFKAQIKDASDPSDLIRQRDLKRFSLTHHFIHEKKCDCVLTVFTGAKWIHRLVQDPTQHSDLLYQYYHWVDTHLGEIRSALDEDTALLVLCPNSIQPLDGQINLNEWFIQNGYLTLEEYPGIPTDIFSVPIDWSKTKCWCAGCSGSVFINLKKRETNGIVDQTEYDHLTNELVEKLLRIEIGNGETPTVKIYKRQDIHFGPFEPYGPDLFYWVQDMPWNTNHLVGHGLGNLQVADKNRFSGRTYNGLYGYFCLSGSKIPANGPQKDIKLLNIAPTVLNILRLEIPYEMEERSILAISKKEQKPAELKSAEDAVRSRLEMLGY